MVRSRKYALVTAALALILIAAVVLTVVLVGDGSFYAEKTPLGSVSSTAVSVGSSTGEVSSDYIYQTLLSHSQKTGEWEESDMQDLQDAAGKHLDNGSTAGDGVKETYVTTLNTNFRLLTQNGWDDVAAESLNVANKSWGGSGYYEVFYNGAWYRFKNGNSSGSLYMSYNAFMTDKDYYQNSSEYALIIEPDGFIQYNPNTIGKNQFFDATLDGAGATLQPSERLNVSRGTGKRGADGGMSGAIWDRYPTGTEDNSANIDSDFDWFSNDRFNYHISKDSNSNYDFHGLNSVGMIFGSVCEGTFKNLKWNDSNLKLSRDDNNYGGHFYSFLEMASSTAFGGLVGVAAPLNAGGTETSTITNVSITYNNYVRHVYDLQHYDDWIDTRCAIFTGGLVGVNMNANISNVTVRMNNDIKFEQRSACVNVGTGWRSADNGFTAFGGVVGLQNCNKTFEKVIISGSNKSSLYGHHQPIDKGSSGYNRTESRQGMVIGYLANNNSLTVNGAILDMNYNECYAWTNKNKSLYRGMLVGQVQSGSSITYQDIYITDMVFGEVYDANTGTGQQYGTNGRPTPADVGIKGGEHDFNPKGTYFGDYTAQYWFDGDAENDQSFGYIDELMVSAVSFSDDPDYMLEISAPDGNKGVFWNVKWQEYGSPYGVKKDNDVFMQNARDDVKVKGFGKYDGVRGKNYYLKMVVEYASSYQLTPRNGVNNNGGDDKDYDKTMVNFPTLKASYLENYEMENHDGKLTQNGYITIGDDGSGNLTFMLNNGSTSVGNTIEHIYINGEDKNADISGNIGSILQLERTAGEEFQVVENNLNAYRAEYNANVYRWTLMGLFAVEDNEGNKTVFAPVSNGINVQVEIDKRPIYMDVVADEVPYIGSAYGVQYGDGSAGAANMVYYQFGTTATNGNGQAVISGDNVTLSQAGISGGQAINVGDYSVTAQGVLSGANNYQLLTAPDGENEFSIVPAEVTLRVTGGSMPYGTTFNAENRAAFVEFVDYTLDFGTNPLQNFAERDGISLNLNLMTTASATTEGQYLFTPSSGGGSTFAYAFPAGFYDVIVEGISGIGSGNYSFNVAQDNEQFEVAKLPLSVTLPSVSDFTYGELDAPALSADDAMVNGLRTGDSVTKELRYYLAADDSLYSPGGRFGAGAYYAQMYISAISSPGSVNGVDNYAINYGKSEFDVLKRDTYVSFDYDPSLTYTYKADLYDDFEALELIDGADGDTVDDVLFAAYSDPERKKPAEALNAGTYYPGATSAALSANYNILGVRDIEGNEWATFVIEKASATLALGDQTTAEYSGNAVPFDKTKITITVADALKGEVETILREALTFTYNGAADAPVNAGTYAVTVTLPELTNYKSTSASLGSVLMITQMKITITPESERVEEDYDGTVIPNLTFAITGSDDRDLSGEITPNVSYYKGDGTDEVAVSLRDVGTYTIVYSYNGATGNYASAEARVTYVVTPATLQITLNNPTAVYNKKAYTPDFKITSGLIVGDNANITYKVNIDGELHDNYEIKDAGSYTLQFSAGNSNYVIAEDDVQQIVTIEKYVLSAQAVNMTVFFNSENRAPEYYENQLRVRVTDADGSDIGSKVTIAKELLKEDGSASVTEVNESGDYQVKVTVTLPNDPVNFAPDNYDVRESVYSVFIYRIALSGELNGGTDEDSVEYGNAFVIKGVLTAMAGDLPQALEVDETGAVIGISENPDLTDVTSITITQATISVSGTTLAINNNSVSLGNISSDVNAIFNTGIFNDGFKNAGTYTATIEVTLYAEYTEPSSNRPVTLSAPFTWTIDPYKIDDVTLGQLNKYYTEAITVDDIMGNDDIMGVVGIDAQYKSFVTAVSAAIGDGTSYVNAGDYDYDLVLNTDAPGYFNYTLPAVETGKINVQQLTVQVSAADAEEQYGNAVTPEIKIVVLKGDAPMTAEEISALGTSFTSQYSYATALTYKPGDGVGLYEGAINVTVTATANFKTEEIDGDVNVIPRKIQITLGNLSMVYGTEQLPALTYTLTGGTTLFTGDDMPALATDGLTLDSEAAPAVNRINANSYAYDFTSLSSQDENYEITAHNGGTLTVTPYVITSVTWDTSAAPVYKGSEFAAEELFTIADMDMPNGDVVTFGVAYTDGQGGKVVKNAGAYTAAATVASVVNGTEPVETGNYDVSRVATQSLTVSAATLSLSAVKGVQAVNDVFAPHVYYDISGAAQELVLADFTFVFGDATYDADRDGELTFSVTYSQSGLPVSPVNAGAYDVSVTVNGSNFNRAVFANIVLTIDKVTLDTLDGFAEVIAPENIMFDNLKHEPTVNFVRETATYSFTYFKVTQSEEGDIVVDEQSSDPIDAADYYARIVVDSANVHYETAGDYEVEFTISPTDKIAVDISVPTSAGLNDNNVYYNGTAVIPVAQATITQNNPPQVTVTGDDEFAFTYKFHMLAPETDDESTKPETVEIDINGKKYEVLANYHNLDEAIETGSYYIEYWFNKDLKHNGNYVEVHGFLMSGDQPTIMQIVTGNMGTRFIAVTTQQYNGLAGYQGRDVIYKDSELGWRINTDLITFSGVNLDGMKDQMTELKTGEIVISVSYLYDMTDGVPRYTKLYDYTWGFDKINKVRTEPVKKYYPVTRENNEQVTGPYGSVYDFGYANGQSTAVYLIEIEVDNRHSADVPENLKDVVDVPDSGSSYSSAMEVYTNEDGEPIRDDNDNLQYIPTKHRGSGTVSVAPASIEFEMRYTSDFYQSGADMLENGYNELNDVAMGKLTQDLIAKAQFIMRGVAIPSSAFEYEGAVETNSLLKIFNSETGDVSVNVTGSNYYTELFGEEVRYEVLDKTHFHLKVTDEKGRVVYAFNVNEYNNGSQNVDDVDGITNAGTYTFEFVFDGMNGKYLPFSYTWDFVQQAAEYHITVTQNEDANLTTPFGTEFDLNRLNGALNAKLETGDLGTATGSYTNFVEAFERGEYGNYIKLVGSEGGSNVPYTDYQVRGVESPVGSYYISYVFVSKDPNLEIMMETAESMIEVKSTAPKLIQVENGETIYEEVEEDKDEQGDETSGGEQGGETGEQEPKPEPVLVGYDIGNVSFAMNTAQNEYVLGFVKLGLKYTTLKGNTETYYLTTNVGISKILYLPDGADEKDESAWVEYAKDASIMSVGKYKIWFETVNDPNLEGAYEDLYVLFEIVKIEATAYVTSVGGISVGDDNVIDSVYNGSEFTVGWAVREANGSNVSQAALAGTVVFNIYTKLDGENKPDPDTKVDKVLNAGTYYVSVSVEGSTNYNVTASAFVTVTIAKADLRVRFGGSEDDFKFIYSRNGSTIDSDTYSFELNNARVDLGDDSNAVVYYLTKDGETIENGVLVELVKAYLEAVKAPGSEELTIDEWLKKNEEYAGYKFTSVNGTNAATDVGTYYPIVVYGGDTNFNKSANLIENGAYPEITISKAIVKATVSSTWIADHELEYGEKLIVENIDYKDVFTSIEWFTREGGATDDSQVDDPADFFAEIGASPRYEVKNNGVYNQGDEVGTYAAAIELEITFESKNYDLEYTTSVADIEVKPKSVKVYIGDVAVALGTLGQQTLVEGGVKFNGVYNGSSFGMLELVVGDGFVFGIEGYDETVVVAESGKYGVLTVTMSGTLAEGGAMIAGSYSSSVDFALNNANYTIDLYDGGSKLTTLGSIDDTPYSVPVSLDVAKAVLRVDFDELKYKWLNETFTERVSEGSGEHQGWWEYATMYTGRNFRRNERLLIQSGYYDGGKWVPYGVYAQQGITLGDIINATELGIVVTDGESGMLAAAGEYSFHLAISSTNYEFERADKSRSSAIDVNITISPSEALEVNLDLAPLFTNNGKVWEREFDGMTIKARTIMGDYLKVYRYEIPQGENALTGEVQLKRTTLGDATDGVFAKGVKVTLAGDKAVGGSIIYAGDYTLTVNVKMDNMAERTEEVELKITPAKQESVDAEISNRSKSSMTYNGSSIVPSFDFKITVKEALSDVKHTQKVNSYSVKVSKDGEELFTYAVEGGVVNMTDEQRAMLANAGEYKFELIVDSATMPNLEDGATFAFKGAITINARPITDSSIRWSYRESFDFKSENGEAVAVTKEGINFIAYYNRDTLLVDGTDYELTFNGEAGKYTGEYTFTVTGKGNFTSTSTSTITGTYYIGASVGPTEAPAALTYGADDKIIVKLAVNSLAPGSADIINDIHLAFDDSARLVTEGGTTVSQLRLESISPEGGNFIAVFGGVGAVNAGTYYLSLSFSCEYEYEEGKVIGSGGEINTDVSGSEVCKVVVQPASAAAVADSVNAVLTEVNSNNATFVIDGKANVYEYSRDGGTTWDKAYKGENTVTGLTPSEHYTIKFRMNDSNYAEGGVTVYPLSVQLPVDTTTNVDEILAQAQELAGNFNVTGFGRYVELMDDLNSVSVADREARAEEIEEALAAIEEARSEYMADLQAAIDSAVDTAEKATGKGIGVSAVGTAAVVGGAAMPAALGIGFIFAAARKRKSKEEDLND